MTNILNTTDDPNQQSVPPIQNPNDNSQQQSTPYFTPNLKQGAFESPVLLPNETQGAAENKVEKETVQEITRPAPIPAALQDTQTQTQPTDDQSTKTIKPNVVDKKTNKETLHPVGKSADAITTLADKEEEEFITNVEKHHGKK